MIIVTGTVLARPDSFDALLAASTQHVLRSRAEPGCVSHAVLRDTEEPLRLHFVERWDDLAALKVHIGVPASMDFGKALRELSAERGSMTVYDASELPLG